MKTSTMVRVEHPFLCEMDEHHAQLLLDGAVCKTFPAGEILFREGEPACRFYLLQSGEVALESTSAGSGTVPVQTLRGGDVLGWSWLFPPYICHFQARVVSPTRAVVCDGAKVLVKAEEDPVFGFDLIKRVSQIMIQRLQAARRSLVRGTPSSTGPAGQAAVPEFKPRP